MNKLGKIFYSLYFWLIGGGLALIFAFFMILVGRIFPMKIRHFLLKKFLSLLFFIMFLKPKIIYEEDIDKDKTYIFMPNHVSMMDVLMNAAYLPVFANGIEAHTHFKWPIYGSFIKIFNQIPINRKSISESLEAFEIAKQRLKNGWSIVVYPEGTRSVSGQLQTFKKLPFKFAKDAEVDVVPVAFVGIEKIAPEKSIFLVPRKTNIIFLKKIEASIIRNIDEDILLRLVQQRISEAMSNYTTF